MSNPTMPNLKQYPPHEDLFNKSAKDLVNLLDTGNSDKYTQIRRFYNEVAEFTAEIGDSPDIYKNKIAFFKMLSSKAAYAKGRSLISENFQTWLQHCVEQVDSPKTLTNFKYHFEAVLGFVKERNKN